MSDHPSLDVDVVSQGSRVRVRLEGYLDASTLPIFLDAVEPLAAVARDITLDCAGLRFCDSSGLRGMIVVRNIVGPDGRFAIAHPRDDLRKLLELTALTSLLDTDDDPPAPPT